MNQYFNLLYDLISNYLIIVMLILERRKLRLRMWQIIICPKNKHDFEMYWTSISISDSQICFSVSEVCKLSSAKGHLTIFSFMDQLLHFVIVTGKQP